MTQDKVWEGQRGERKGDQVQRLLDTQLMKGWEVKARGPGSQVRLLRIIPWSSSFTVPFCLTLSSPYFPFLSPFPLLSLLLTLSYLLCPCNPPPSVGEWGCVLLPSVLHHQRGFPRGSVSRLCNGSSAERREVGKGSLGSQRPLGSDSLIAQLIFIFQTKSPHMRTLYKHIKSDSNILENNTA